MAEDFITVEVVYATPARQLLLALQLPRGSSAAQAIAISGITQQFPEIDLQVHAIGIFSQPCSLAYVVQPGDRIEIYRPLLHDPKDARRARALQR